MHKRKHCPKRHERALFSSSKELLSSFRGAGKDCQSLLN